MPLAGSSSTARVKQAWSGLSLPHRCHTEGRQIGEAEMARLFPAAALALLECEDEKDEEAR